MTPQGLDDVEAQRRAAAGQSNAVDDATTRSFGAIVRANVMTRFNALLGSLLVVILVVGPPQDALFGIVLVTNTVIGVVQEVRAKRTLERLVIVAGTTTTVVRSGRSRTVPSAAVVVGDLVELHRGDQIVVDGPVVESDGLEVDESLLTGESDAVAKPDGSTLLSGSWVTAGTGLQVAEGVSESAYARRLAVEGRRFALTRSELRAGIDTILQIVTWVLVPTALLLSVSQLVQSSDLEEAIRASVAGVVNMVPEGLVLLTSTALAVGVIRLGRRHVLVQELSALEGLSRVDVLCVDKTGTITEGAIELASVRTLDGCDAETILAGFAATDPDPNATMQAVRRALPAAPWPISWRVPFSSTTRWSAIASDDVAWVLGAPEALLPWTAPPFASLVERAHAMIDELVDGGHRVLVLGCYPSRLGRDAPVEHLRPLAVVGFGETIRRDAASIVRWFRDEGVQLRVLSGDEPRTLLAVARAVGIDEDAVNGRMSPEDKRAMIAALQAQGHTVGMIGDGVNDVLALKQADLGIALATGSPAARSAAQIVMVDSQFEALPAIVAEGRRVTGNVERVAKLFVTKTVYACLLAFAVGVARLPFPFFPRHLTLVSSLTIGAPALVLALAPSAARIESGFTRRVLATAAPLGAVAAAATFAGYALARDDGLPASQARTVATFVLFGVGLCVLSIVARPLTPARRWLVAAMAAAFAAAVVTPSGREVFALDVPRPLVVMAVVGLVALAGGLMEGGRRVAALGTFGPVGKRDPPGV